MKTKNVVETKKAKLKEQIKFLQSQLNKIEKEESGIDKEKSKEIKALKKRYLKLYRQSLKVPVLNGINAIVTIELDDGAFNPYNVTNVRTYPVVRSRVNEITSDALDALFDEEPTRIYDIPEIATAVQKEHDAIEDLISDAKSMAEELNMDEVDLWNFYLYE